MFPEYPKLLYRPGTEAMIERVGYDILTVTDADAEAAARKQGWGAVGETHSKGPLDGSVKDLIAHLSDVDDAKVIRALIADEKAGKTRAGALAALEARLDEIT